MLVIMSVNNSSAQIDCVNNVYLSLHKFLANYKPKVVNDEQSALAKPESIYVKNNK